MRPVVRRSNYMVTGKHPSFKNKASIRWESFIERDCFIRLDVDQSVTSYNEQPCLIRYEHKGVIYTHVPDVLVIHNSEKTLVEIKSANAPTLDEAVARASILSPLLLIQGIRYRVLTDLDIREEPFFSNAKTLLHFGYAPADSLTTRLIKDSISAAPLSWAKIIEGAIGMEAAYPVARLILTGQLHFDMHRPLGEQTMISTIKPLMEKSSWL